MILKGRDLLFEIVSLLKKGGANFTVFITFSSKESAAKCKAGNKAV
jgi:hypothetical protein